MARFDIISKDGSIVRYSGKPRYNGSYLKPSFLEFSEIASSTPIQWEVGDYVDYPRTGMRYRLYSIPQPSKNARKGAVGNSFTYSNVQFFSATKELEIALFRDLVDNDNNIHFSTSPDVATFENVEGIIRRIQVCMNDLYPDRWEIRLASFDANEDAEVIERIAEPRDFALSGGTCLDALSKIYDLWDGIGWFHSHENGKEIITVGYANTRNAGNTTESYLYGKGNGLTAIKKHQTNKEEFATRLYVYGSERNLPARYYNEKNILNAESVDIRNLMLPLDSWGKTDGLPDARKAYLENAEAVAKFGVIPKVHYFDSVDAGADIYPSIEGMTIGRLRKALEALGDIRYYPSASLYPDASKRIDEVRSCENPDDAGVINPEDLDKEEVSFAAQWGKTRKMSTGVVSDTAQIASFEFSIDEPTPCEVVVNPNVSGYIDDKGFDSVTVTLRFRDHSGTAPYNPTVRVSANKVGDKWEFMLPNIRYNYAGSPRTIFPVYLDFVIEAFGDSPEHASYILNDGTITYSLKPIQDETFVIQLDEIGFNIDEMALKGKGKTISMKTGSCAGRSFVIEEARRKGGYWNLICKRQQDNTLGLLFPNSAYEIAKGDRFVLLDIAMPETYVYAASDRLLAEGEKLLARASRIQNHYEPAIDAKVMIESGRTLREGMFMSIEDEDVVDNTTDYIIIDTLSIYEDESAIPTYRVTLRERRKVTYKGTPSATSSTDTQPVEKETNETTASSFESFWEEDENGNVFTTRQIRIKNNLIVDGDTASGGEGVSSSVGIQGIKLNGTTYRDENSDGIIDLGVISGGGGLTSVDWDDVQNKPVFGTLAYKNGLTASEVGALSTSGGTINGAITISSGWYGNQLTLNITNSDDNVIRFQREGVSLGFLGFTSANTPVFANTSGTPYTLYHTGNFNPANYLPLSGGTISGTTNGPLNINTSNASEIGLSLSINSSKKAWFGYNTALGTTQGAAYMYNAVAKKYMGIFDDGSAFLGGNKILTSAGGKVQGLVILGSGTSYLAFEAADGTAYGSIGVSSKHEAKFWDGAGAHTLIHSKNVGEYKAGGIINRNSAAVDASDISVLNSFYDNNAAFSLGTFKGLTNIVGTADGVVVNFPRSSAYGQQWFVDDNSHTIKTRYKNSDKSTPWSDWKTIAFTDSNVASATKLATARTIWGQSFDGTGNVSGDIHLNQSDIYWHNDKANYSIESVPREAASPYLKIAHYGGIHFYTQGAEKMRIADSGNVGIGASSPSSKLSVDSNAASSLPSLGALATKYTIEFGYAGKYGTYLGTLGSGIGFIQQGRSDGTATAYNLLLQPLGGNVLIGATTDNGGKLQVEANVPNLISIKRTNTYAGAYIDYIAANAANKQWRVGAADSGSFVFENNNSGTAVNSMLINPSGNVTIGDTDKALSNYKLWANGSVRVSNGTYSDILEFDDNGGRITFWNGSYHAGTIEASKLILNAATNGKVLIGTTTDSGAKLQVNGNISGKGIYGTNIELSDTTPFIDFHYGNSTSDYTSRIIEDASGRLYLNRVLYLVNGERAGIGGINSSYKFNVEGDTMLNGAVAVTSTLNVSGVTTLGSNIFIPNNNAYCSKKTDGTRVDMMYVSKNNVLGIGIGNLPIEMNGNATIKGNLVVQGDISA